MQLLINILIIIACVFGLWGGAIWIVESASKFAKKLGLSDLIIGLTIVAVATSAPEFAVTVLAAFRRQYAISVGNVVGSDIFNLGFILGLIVLFTPVKITKSIFYRDGFMLVGTGILLLIFFSDLELSLIEGIILSITLVLYIIVLIRQKKISNEEIPEDKFVFWDIPKFFIGIFLIIISAEYLVKSASELARMFGISEWMIGITIVAGGTSMPELATSVVALSKKNYGISAGNLIGSDLFNMLGVLGVAAILNPLSISINEYFGLILLALSLFLLLLMMRTGWRISRIEGIILILIALFRWSFDFIIK